MGEIVIDHRASRERVLFSSFRSFAGFSVIHWFLLVPYTLCVLATTFDATLMSA